MEGVLRNVAAVVAAVALALPSPSRAQSPARHAHSAPHGGEVYDVAGHHVEVKVDSSGSISVWLLDAQENTLAPPEGATITLVEAPGCEHTLPLRVDAASQRLTAQFDPDRYFAFEALVSLRIASRREHVRFRYPARH